MVGFLEAYQTWGEAMTRRHRVAAEWVPEEPPAQAACLRDFFGGWEIVLTIAAIARQQAARR